MFVCLCVCIYFDLFPMSPEESDDAEDGMNERFTE